MMGDDYTIGLRAIVTFDPPDMPPGWYVDIQVLICGKVHYPTARYGPIDFEQLEAAKADLLHYETSVVEKSVEYLKRSITERIHNAEAPRPGYGIKDSSGHP